MDASHTDRIALAAKNWRETEKQVLATKGAPVPDVAAKSAHHHAKLALRQAVDKALEHKSGVQP